MYRITFISAILWVYIAADCFFPEKWIGTWYEDKYGQITITNTSIEKKGTCWKHLNDYYLIYDSTKKCNLCMLIIPRHENIIQYKESYCVNDESMQSICAIIRHEWYLHTLVRDPAIPVECPYVDAYFFNYNNNSGGYCRSQNSYVQSCSTNSKFKFQFSHCPEAAYTYDQSLSIECLATWRDGSDMFMYGILSTTKLLSKMEWYSKYRCLMYSVFGTVVYLALSGDSTCRGLISSKDGPLVMEFTKDVSGWPHPECRFPEWLIEDTWQDMSGNHEFSATKTGETIKVSWRHNAQTDENARVKFAYRCMHIDHKNTTSQTFVAVSFTSRDWPLDNEENVFSCLSKRVQQSDSIFQCIRIVKIDRSIAEIHLGSMVDQHTDICTQSHFSNARKHMIIQRSMKGTPCPFFGRYHVINRSGTCDIDIRSGCNRTSQMEVLSSCRKHPIVLECMQLYEEHGENFLITRLHSKSPVTIANCFSWKRYEDKLIFASDRICNQNAPHIFEKSVYYEMNSQPDKCGDLKIAIHPHDLSANPSHLTDENDKGYKVVANEGNIGYYDDDPGVVFYGHCCLIDSNYSLIPSIIYFISRFIL